MGNFMGFSFQSKEEREKEYQSYVNKLFPYGEAQSQKVRDILNALVGKKDRAQLMLYYILVKEALIDSESKDYEKIVSEIDKKKIIKLTPELKNCIRILIEKDLNMDETLNYPTPDELKAKAGDEL